MQAELCAALADDLEQLIRLHDRELDATTMTALQAAAFPGGLAMSPADEAGGEVSMALADIVGAWASPPAVSEVDRLAADFAGIYLNNSTGASPFESVWLTDEHLVAQQPMFEWRDILAADGVRVGDWRQRYDDHFVVQLQWLAQRLRQPTEDWARIAMILDEHLLYWFPEWAARVEARADSPFYATLGALTWLWLTAFRQLLDEVHALPLPPREAVTAKIRAKLKSEGENVAPIRFMPAAEGPSW